ncbi:glycolate oxidase subunit GlcE [Candidatus Nitrosacidococcus tergens]|uniref:Glycolate oxidase FAD binding subunit n=1 Tax=Candidatus Nitrosacidococcus tergens TaxID=553981 RepID=A0A7G1Q955_9GAMM|nr:glycolate oxidase subunit GlcE [Candidatus Nitrosacidococcus tergens]CAB1275685.1 glycolate oxidase FAD binding subunit [Candidatus Nitrosacidococcus tergens]
MNSTDYSKELQETIYEAYNKKTPLCIVGGNTKEFYGRQPLGIPLNITKHRGIISYEPEELVISARAGTSLSEIESLLAKQNQMLGFEPPHFGKESTLGGMVAAGLSGPRRPYGGAIRDSILGVTILNGKGEKLRFGGQVVKNVAGYDVSRLMVGSLGTLGVLLEISLKVLPRPPMEITLTQQQTPQDALHLFNSWTTEHLPISGSVFDGESIYVRLAGFKETIRAAQQKIGGEQIDNSQGFWAAIRDHTYPFFKKKQQPLWRWSVPIVTPPIDLPGTWFVDWAGSQRWFHSDLDPALMRVGVERIGGHATIFRGGDRNGKIFHPLSNALINLHYRLKQAFDPRFILNPRRMYDEF